MDEEQDGVAESDRALGEPNRWNLFVYQNTYTHGKELARDNLHITNMIAKKHISKSKYFKLEHIPRSVHYRYEHKRAKYEEMYQENYREILKNYAHLKQQFVEEKLVPVGGLYDDEFPEGFDFTPHFKKTGYKNKWLKPEGEELNSLGSSKKPIFVSSLTRDQQRLGQRENLHNQEDSEGQQKVSPEDFDREESSCSCLVKLNKFFSLKFFFMLILGMQTDLLVGAFANLRFLRLNSIFGLVNLGVALLVTLLVLAMLAVSFYKLGDIKRLKSAEKNQKNQNKNPPSSQSTTESWKTDPKIKHWLFLEDDYDIKDESIWMHF